MIYLLHCFLGLYKKMFLYGCFRVHIPAILLFSGGFLRGLYIESIREGIPCVQTPLMGTILDKR